jgi:hypothetical protein
MKREILVHKLYLNLTNGRSTTKINRKVNYNLDLVLLASLVANCQEGSTGLVASICICPFVALVPFERIVPDGLS